MKHKHLPSLIVIALSVASFAVLVSVLGLLFA